MLFIILLLLGLGFIVRSYVAGRRPQVAFAVGLGLVAAAFLAPGVAGASTLEEPTPVGPDSLQADSLLNLPPYLVAAFLGSIVPLVTGFLTKPSTPTWVKVWGSNALALLVGVITVATTEDGGAVISWSTVAAGVVAWLSKQAAYSGVYKPQGVTSNDGGKLATVGVK